MGYSLVLVQQDGDTEEKYTLHETFSNISYCIFIFFFSREQIWLEQVMQIFPLGIPECTSWTLL